ncbi:type IV pilus biogenesis protein PilM [Maridesulfovibrio frigidus]|uniref:type IV pilus biogenesis protein PilM n=1 Tax=Maridesulfovibrio frigidus TaxID=340956 RepID=UPI0004E143BB|nr:type IV pilus biogenesis protein PilM [Maridesulfovibrio frigidus]
MQGLAIFFCLLGTMAMVSQEMPTQRNSPKAESIAVNYAIYRNAVNNFVTSNSTITTGEVPVSNLSIPPGWKPMRAWANRMDSGNCYVWGAVQGNESEEIRKIFMGSFAIGVKRNGFLTNAHGADTTLPAFIPENSIVSVITH